MERDNAQYLYERLIYNNEFVTFMETAYCQCCLTVPSIPKAAGEIQYLLYEVGDRMFIDLLPHFAMLPTPALSGLCVALSHIFSASADASKALLGKLVANPLRAFGLLVQCPEVPVRQYVQKLLLTSFITTISTETEVFDRVMQREGKANVTYYVAISRQFIELLVNFIGYDLAANWVKFRQFFELLRDIVLSGGYPLVCYCFAKDLPAILLDFFLEKRSPQYSLKTKRYDMGNPAQAPDFSPLIELLSFLLRKAGIPRKGHDKAVAKTETLISPMALGEQEFALSEIAARSLLLEDLIFKHMNCGGKIEQISPLVLHLCFENKLHTFAACQTMLRVINDTDAIHMSFFVDLIADLLTLVDSYQAQRIEWLLGCPHPLSQGSFGLAHIRSIFEDVNFYISPIIVCGNICPLLAQMWNYRLRQKPLVVQCVRTLLKVASSSPAVNEYLQQIPAPNYCFARYTDWFGPFLDSFNDAKGTDKEVLEETKKLLVAYSKGLEGGLSGPPQNYMIGNTISTGEMKEKERSVRDVRLSFTEVVTEVYPSAPTGEANVALSSDYLSSYYCTPPNPFLLDTSNTCYPTACPRFPSPPALFPCHLPNHQKSNPKLTLSPRSSPDPLPLCSKSK